MIRVCDYRGRTDNECERKSAQLAIAKSYLITNSCVLRYEVTNSYVLMNEVINSCILRYEVTNSYVLMNDVINSCVL